MAACALVSKDWRELSEAASKERDPNKLMELIAQLNEALREREERSRAKLSDDSPRYN